ncbi:allantoicase [Caulobacter ginsengisoli]|uniref:Probable allantoicase n=1 Tax=Caulobacter ginsengisoli TaxID=400775 RepID=A0ABU0IRT3_9CAUL|nr:allantoicase [Caulobacter ginsengisoli]MDQ0464721.1 allantoicase [Caulobacter ginsengisoli]
MSDFSPVGLIDLAQPRLGAEVVYATDDFFADKSRLIDPAEPVFIPGKYDDNGKWMDGWESRRKRVPGYDWAIVRLGVPGRIAGFEIDTRHFTGNYPPRASIDGCYCREAIPPGDTAWTSLLGVTDLQGDSRRLAAAETPGVWTHVRLNIFPDGGVARLRVFGRVEVDWSAIGDRRVDLLALENGGRGLLANNEHYGRVENLTAPGRGRDMGDGWETRRRREPGHDWAVLALGHAGRIEEILVDTRHFKGNYPDRCMIQATTEDAGPLETLEARSAAWPVLLPEVKLQADAEHRFEVADSAAIRFVRLNIFPDGGVSRLRLWGRQA